jgi:Na+-transporting methylmalonyl-CoA/oxaloacetate decarboxylase gamma subunit
MIQAFELMALGMGGDFFVLFVIYVVSKLMLKLLPPKKA